MYVAAPVSFLVRTYKARNSNTQRGKQVPALNALVFRFQRSLTMRRILLDCEQSLIFLCKVTASTQSPRTRAAKPGAAINEGVSSQSVIVK